jgi:hypothetical protein
MDLPGASQSSLQSIRSFFATPTATQNQCIYRFVAKITWHTTRFPGRTSGPVPSCEPCKYHYACYPTQRYKRLIMISVTWISIALRERTRTSMYLTPLGSVTKFGRPESGWSNPRSWGVCIASFRRLSTITRATTTYPESPRARLQELRRTHQEQTLCTHLCGG